MNAGRAIVKANPAGLEQRPSVQNTVALVAPSGAWRPADLEAGLSLLASLGRPVRFFASLGSSPDEDYLAASDEARARGIEAALADDAVGILWAIRGGYGALRLLPRLDLDAFARQRKPLMGLSDVSLLLNAVTARTGLVTYHGPVLRSVPALDVPSLATLRTWLTSGALPDRYALEHISGESLEGPLVVANLATLCSAIGTSWMPALQGALLVIEELNEAPYRLDRMLQQLLQSGALSGLGGLLFGELLLGDQPIDFLPTWLRDAARAEGFALARGLPVGHGPRNTILPIGAMARLEQSGDGAASLQVDT
jgi:muramoyltetrapeptide carboxypeptidase